MITPQDLCNSFALNVRLIKKQTEGLSHVDSLLQPPFQGNCLNWVVGHVLSSRGRFMTSLLGLAPVIPQDELARYFSGTEPITADGAGVLPLENIMALLDQTQVAIETRLPMLTDVELAEKDETERTLGQRLFGFYFHETYHTGQPEYLRQLTGINDKVI